MNEHQKDTRIDQLERELRLKQRQLDQRDDELSGLKLKIRDLHELLKTMVEAYRDTSLKAVYEQRLAKSMADAMDRMDDIVLQPATWNTSSKAEDQATIKYLQAILTDPDARRFYSEPSLQRMHESLDELRKRQTTTDADQIVSMVNECAVHGMCRP